MDAWTSGYVAEVGYTHGFYRELTPAILQFSALTKGLVAPWKVSPLTYCELGCGQGFSANLLAAANPGMQYYATDFNPSQIISARRLAEQAETKNVHFFNDSFAEFAARDDLPQFDIISLHGIYSWIALEHRKTIVAFIDKHLKPGGLVYISYNCLPGWAGPSPLRQLMRMAGQQTAGSMVHKIDSALALIEKIQGAGARYFATVPGIAERIEKIKGQDRNYLAHEYMNADWTLFYHADVASELSSARLSYTGSAHLMDHVDAVNLTTEQQNILKDTNDPIIRETLRDYMINQQFRRDIFSRGKINLTVLEAREAWLNNRFVLSTPRADVSLKIVGSMGEANLQPEVYLPLLDVLAEANGPISLRKLTAIPTVAELGWGRLQQAILVLVGAGYVQPCPMDTKNDGKRRERVRAFNQVVINRARYSADLQFLASPATGGGISVDRFQQLFILAMNHKADPAQFTWQVLNEQGQRLLKDGKTLESAEDNLAELQVRVEFFEKRLPTLKNLGLT
jgi:SAM-dependent methyltransferase